MISYFLYSWAYLIFSPLVFFVAPFHFVHIFLSSILFFIFTFYFRGTGRLLTVEILLFHFNIKELVEPGLFLECQPIFRGTSTYSILNSTIVAYCTSIWERCQSFLFLNTLIRRDTPFSTEPWSSGVSQVPQGCLQQMGGCTFHFQVSAFKSNSPAVCISSDRLLSTSRTTSSSALQWT